MVLGRKRDTDEELSPFETVTGLLVTLFAENVFFISWPCINGGPISWGAFAATREWSEYASNIFRLCRCNLQLRTAISRTWMRQTSCWKVPPWNRSLRRYRTRVSVATLLFPCLRNTSLILLWARYGYQYRWRFFQCSVASWRRDVWGTNETRSMCGAVEQCEFVVRYLSYAEASASWWQFQSLSFARYVVWTNINYLLVSFWWSSRKERLPLSIVTHVVLMWCCYRRFSEAA